MTRNDEKKIEAAVYVLFAVKGTQVLTPEKQFASKKVDLYFERRSF